MPSATDALRTSFDRILAIIQTPGFLASEAGARRAAVRKISDGMVDWDEMARRALGRHWQGRSAVERRAFTARFARLAERMYMGEVERYQGRRPVRDPIGYVGETRDGTETIVHTRLGERDIPVDFHMAPRKGHWRVCDVAVDGVSIADNYRAQIERVITRSSYRALVERMEARTAEPDGAPAAALPRSSR